MRFKHRWPDNEIGVSAFVFEDWRHQQDKILRDLQRHQDADQHYLEEGITVFEMSKNARRLFDQEQPMEKRRLLNFVVSNSTWANGELKATLREPFGFIAEMAKFASSVNADSSQTLADHSGWLGN